MQIHLVFLVAAFVCNQASAFLAPQPLSSAPSFRATATASSTAKTRLTVAWANNNKVDNNACDTTGGNDSLTRGKDEQEEYAHRLLEKARLLREEIEASERQTSSTTSTTTTTAARPITKIVSPWSLVETDDNATAYRFYVDIGREEGTWMSPRWGASGQRIEFSLDVRFSTDRVSRQVAEEMVQDNRGGGGSSSSPVCRLDTAPFARLRRGFDKMQCDGGAYRIDASSKNNSNRSRGQKTLRLFLRTEAKQVGDVSVPDDSHLHISLPVLADSSLSRREGIVSVRQYGWHTGWYTLESRIVGVVKVVPLAEAQTKDGF